MSSLMLHLYLADSRFFIYLFFRTELLSSNTPSLNACMQKPLDVKMLARVQEIPINEHAINYEKIVLEEKLNHASSNH